jgi:transcriptional regulatory protein LevR
MANKCSKGETGSRALAIMEIKTKIALRLHFTVFRIAYHNKNKQQKRQRPTNVRETVEKEQPLRTYSGKMNR